MIRFINNLLNKKRLMATVVFGALLFLFVSFAQVGLAKELENEYPKIPIPGMGKISLNDIFDAVSGDTSSPAYAIFKDKPMSALVLYFYTFSIVIVGIVAFGVIIMTGVKFMTSGASPGMRKEAMDQLRAVILGIALLLGSWILLNTINPELTILAEPGTKDLGWWKGGKITVNYVATGIAGTTLTGGPILSFDIRVDAPYNYEGPDRPNPIKPGDTVTLYWGAPEGSGDCAAYSSPTDIKGWGDPGKVEVIGTIKGQQIPHNSTNAGYKLTIPVNQREGTYTLKISCAGVRAEASTQLVISSLTAETIASLPKATVDLKFQKKGSNFQTDAVFLAVGQKNVDGDFKYTITGDAIDKKTIGNCTLTGGGKKHSINQDFASGSVSSFVPGLGLEFGLIPGEYSLSCLDKDTKLEIGRDTVVVTIVEFQ